MEKKLTLYKLVTDGSGRPDRPFPLITNPVTLNAFTYEANRMGGAPTISGTAYHSDCLDNKWDNNVYVEFNGEKYYIKNVPTSSKSNEDERYKYEIELKSEREILDHVYFIDAVQVDSSIDKYKSNTTKVIFMGNIQEYAARLNACFAYHNLDYSVVIDEGVTTEEKQVSFEDKYISEALQEGFTIYEVPYYYVGKVIHFGYTDDAIPYIMKYDGIDGALLAISKENANYDFYNKLKGIGSSDNIPYYYPNDSDDREAIEAAGGKWITPMKNLMPPIYRESNGAEQFYEAKNDTYEIPDDEGYYVFENEYSERNPRQGSQTFEDIKPTIKGMTNAQGLRIDMFSEFAYDENDNDEIDEDTNEYIHPYFFGKLRKFDGGYGFNLFEQASEADTMQFSFTSGVCGACNFELGVGEETKKNIVQVDDNGNLKRDAETGEVIRTGNPQDRQNDTQHYEVWVALKKDASTYGQVMPNAHQNLRPSADDTFVILNINLPKAYILKAEDELKESIIKYMYMNNSEKFNFSIKFSRIFFEENPEILEQLNENSRIIVEYNNIQHTFYIDSYTYKMEESAILPEISVNLVDTLTVGQNSLQTKLDSVKQDILSSIGGQDFLKQGLKYFIRKDVKDYALDFITFYKGLILGNYTPNLKGGVLKPDDLSEIDSLNIRKALKIGLDVFGQENASIDENGNAALPKITASDGLYSDNFTTGSLGAGFCLKKQDDNGDSYLEIDRMLVRKVATFIQLLIQEVKYAGGQIILSPASMICSKVEEYDNYYRCYFDKTDGDRTINQEFAAGDQARFQTFNLSEGNAYYWRLVTNVGDDYIDLSKTDCDANSTVPQAGDNIVQLGNRTKTDRQSAIILSSYGEASPYIKLYRGISSYSMDGKEFLVISRAEVNIIADSIKFSTGKEVKDYIDDTAKDLQDELNEQQGYISELQKTAGDLQDQIDGAIESYFESIDPTTDNYPANAWTTEELKQAHANDTYTNINTGKSWKWVKNGNIWEWSVILDTATEKALALAGQAKDTADGKRRVFTSNPTNEDAYDVGDLWVNATYGLYNNDLLRCKKAKVVNSSWSINDWELATKYTDDTSAKEYADSLIANIEIGGRNYAKNTINQFYFTDFRNYNNQVIPLEYSVNGLKKGDNIVVSFDYEAENLIFGQNSHIQIHFGKGYSYKSIGVIDNNGSGSIVSNIIELKNEYNSETPINEKTEGAPLVRFDYISANNGGYFKLKNFMVNKGTIASDWNPAPEDLGTKVEIENITAEFTILEEQIESKVSKETFREDVIEITDGTYAKKTEYDSTITEITQDIDDIILAANGTNTKVTQIGAEVISLGTRVTEAEIALQPDNIWIGVREKSLELTSYAGGEMLYRDPTFRGGNNEIGLYDISGNNNVSLERTNSITGNPNNTGYGIKITCIGEANPYWGGFRWGTLSRANKVYITRIVAKIPIGYKLGFMTNAVGNNSTQEWLTSADGTGDWSEYIFRLKCGGTGDFSTTNYFYLYDGTTPTVSSPLIWYLSFATVYDVTGVDNTPTEEEIKAGININAFGIDVFGKNINFAGTVTFDSLASDAQDKINNAQTTADSAITAVSDSKEDIAKNLGYESYSDLTAKAEDGQTIINGGSINTNLITVDTILAAKIGAAEITTGRITITDGAKMGNFVIENNIMKMTAGVTGIMCGTGSMNSEPTTDLYAEIGTAGTSAIAAGCRDNKTAISINVSGSNAGCISAYCWNAGGKVLGAVGGCNWQLRSGDTWNMPGVLCAARISVSSGGVISMTTWGDGLGTLAATYNSYQGYIFTWEKSYNPFILATSITSFGSDFYVAQTSYHTSNSAIVTFGNKSGTITPVPLLSFDVVFFGSGELFNN